MQLGASTDSFLPHDLVARFKYTSYPSYLLCFAYLWTVSLKLNGFRFFFPILRLHHYRGYLHFAWRCCCCYGKKEANPQKVHSRHNVSISTFVELFLFSFFSCTIRCSVSAADLRNAHNSSPK